MNITTILWLICSLISLPMWWVVRNNACFKKNIVIGVTLPREAHDDEQVAAILASYRRQQLVCTVVLVVSALAGAGTAAVAIRTWTGPLMACWPLWILAACVAPTIIFALTNHKLAILKDKRGWRCRGTNETRRITVADISAASQPYPRVSGVWFILICTASLTPALADHDHLIIYLMFSAESLVMWAIFRWCYRRRSEVVDDDAILMQTLTRIRRRAWARLGLVASAAFALMSWMHFLLFRGSFLLYCVGVMFPCVASGIVAFATEMRVRGLQERLTKTSGKGFYVDEDDHWIFGIFYYNPDDAKLLVNNRIGINTSINLARPAGKAIAIATTLVLLCLPLGGVFMASEYGTPVTLELSGQTIQAHHVLINYEIATDDVTHIESINKLPQMTRTFGGAAETFFEGEFSSTEYGPLKVCLDPGSGPWLLIRTRSGTTYLLGASDTTQTKAVFEKTGAEQR